MILTIQDFQKAYPYLWNAINEARIQSGSNKLDEEYSPLFSIPIRMPDASLADNCLAKNEQTILGQAKLNKIIEIVKSEPNMLRWSDLLYYPNNPRGLYSDRYKANKPKTHKKKEDKMARKNIVNGEIIADVFPANAPDNNSFIAKNRVTNEDLTNQINNQKKLKYAFDNKGVLRGRTKDDGSITWRVVKEKFVKPDEPVTEENA
jgi:sarcosine oxidase delta subunit